MANGDGVRFAHSARVEPRIENRGSTEFVHNTFWRGSQDPCSMMHLKNSEGEIVQCIAINSVVSSQRIGRLIIRARMSNLELALWELSNDG